MKITAAQNSKGRCIPYRHLSITDTSLLRTPLYYGLFVWSQKCQKSYIPYLYNTDTSVKRTLGSVPLLSVLKRFDCNADTSVKRTLGTVPLVSVLRRFDCHTDTSVKWTLGSVPLVSVLKRFDCNTDTSVKRTLGTVPLVSVLRRFDCHTDTL